MPRIWCPARLIYDALPGPVSSPALGDSDLPLRAGSGLGRGARAATAGGARCARGRGSGRNRAGHLPGVMRATGPA